ncbi:Ger(x)C family spore germination protein [Bacillus sp. EAC]|uniref:Ger(x)C family spore germination protein n=1 Tax=Bacillus sp. EAC TaxID=1978338 RepID=UPI00211B7130|nr:Ger(x)C family spore germination protein [Bacillus sp. EAC]
MFYNIFQLLCYLKFFISYLIDICFHKKKTRFLVFNFLIILTTFILSGCTFKDIDKRAFVTSIGIDQSDTSDKKYKVMIKVAIPKGDPKEPESDFVILSSNSDSITEGLSLMKSQIDKELVYGHNNSILIGENLAKSNIQPLLEFFVRRPDIQMTSYLSMAKPNAFEVLNFKPAEEMVSGNFLKSFFDFSKTESPYIDSLFLFDAYRRETEEGINIAMPIVEKKKTQLAVDQIALFNKYKMLMELSSNESETFRLLTTGIYNGNLNLRNKNGIYVINLENGKSKYKLIDKDRGIKAKYMIKIKADIEEKITGLATISESEIADLRKQVEDKIEAEATNLLSKIKKKEIDPIGFGLRYMSRDSENRNMDLWDKKYPKLSFTIQSKVEIKGTGLIQ